MDLVSLFYTQVIPIGLWVVMLGLGLALTPRDIRNLLVMPKAVSVGLLGQLVLLPVLAFCLAASLAPTPAIAVGVIILAACPGGVTSNAYSFASRGDVALSVTLTAVSSFITIFTVPLITYLALERFLAAGGLPVAIGMILRQTWGDKATPFLRGWCAEHRCRCSCRDHEADGNGLHVLRTSLARA